MTECEREVRALREMLVERDREIDTLRQLLFEQENPGELHAQAETMVCLDSYPSHLPHPGGQIKSCCRCGRRIEGSI